MQTRSGKQGHDGGGQVSANVEAADKIRDYLGKCYTDDEPIDPVYVRRLLNMCAGKPDWSMCNRIDTPALHLAVQNGVTPADEMREVVQLLLASGANPDDLDEDGDTALQAVLMIAGEIESDDLEPSEIESQKKAHMAAILTLLKHPATTLNGENAEAIVKWLRSDAQEEGRDEVLECMRDRLGGDAEKYLASGELLEYLEKCAYVEKRGVESICVKAFLDRGASPSTKQNGANTLLLVVLNPYSTYEELLKVMSLLIAPDPRIAAERDTAFKLSAMNWAVDYQNVSDQHGLKEPNPATLLALMSVIVSVCPPEVDCGEICIKASPKGFCTHAPTTATATSQVRFLQGARVMCRVAAPGGSCLWEEGAVVGLWYRERCWPRAHPGAPYQVRLDIGQVVYALVDDDRIIRAEVRRGVAPRTGGYAAATAPVATARFQRRQKPDGSGWEMLDTKSGKARPCSPPGSDDE